MSDRTALGDRMKLHEQSTRFVLPRRTFTLIRVDGRAFHSYLRGAEKPYDFGFMADMDAVAQPLREEVDVPGLQWVADAAVPASGCLVESAGTVVDAGLDRRWQRAIAALGLQSPWEPVESADADH